MSSAGSLSRQERRKAATAAAILDAAEVRFRERGFQAATIDEIAERADVSVGSLAMTSSNIGRAKDLYAAFSVEPAGAVPVAEVVS